MERARFDVRNGRIPFTRIELGDILISNIYRIFRPTEEYVVELDKGNNAGLSRLITAFPVRNGLMVIDRRDQFTSGEFEFTTQQFFGPNTIGFHEYARKLQDCLPGTYLNYKGVEVKFS